jgi:hypothetical protein
VIYNLSPNEMKSGNDLLALIKFVVVLTITDGGRVALVTAEIQLPRLNIGSIHLLQVDRVRLADALP